MRYSVEETKTKLANVLCANGVEYSDARTTACVLIEGDLRGYTSHGIGRILQIIEGFKNKTLKAANHSKLLKDSNTITIIDGNGYLGQPLGREAMLKSIEKSKKYGIGISGVINSGHIGILGYYSELAIKHECIGVVMSTSSPAVALKGSGKKTFGTNPISFSIPSGIYSPILADFSTSRVSRGKIYEYLKNKKEIPQGWAVDAHGRSTTDPLEALKGGLTTLDSDIKGASISLLVSILAGPLIGGVINPLVKGTRYMNETPNKGDLFISIDVSSFGDVDFFKNSIDDLINVINEQESEYRIPGTNSFYKKEKSIKDGIEISEEVVDLLNKYSNEEFYHAD